GEPPDEKRIDRAEEDLALLGPAAEPRNRVEQVPDLGAREIGIDDEAGLRADHRLAAVALQPVADRRRHTALPDDRVRNRPARLALPQHRRLALVGDADRGQIGGRGARALQGPPRDRPPDPPATRRARVALRARPADS